MDVIVTWEDNTKNCVKITELKPAKKNGKVELGARVKMSYDSKWYFGIVTAIENPRTGKIKSIEPEQHLSGEFDSECVVIVTWDDNTKNSVSVSELKPAKKNGALDLGARVKMRYGSKWYFGIISATENPKTGEIKTLDLDEISSDASDAKCSDDDIPLSSFVYKHHKIMTDSIAEEKKCNGDNCATLYSNLDNQVQIQTTASTVTQNPQEASTVTDEEAINSTAKGSSLSCDMQANVTFNSNDHETASASNVKPQDKNVTNGDCTIQNEDVNYQLQRFTFSTVIENQRGSSTVTNKEAFNFTMIDNLSSNSKQFEINGAPSEQVQRFTAPQGSTPVPGEDAITNKNNSSDFGDNCATLYSNLDNQVQIQTTASTVTQNPQEASTVTDEEAINSTAKGSSLSCDMQANVTFNSNDHETASASNVKPQDKNVTNGDCTIQNEDVNYQLQRFTFSTVIENQRGSSTVTNKEAFNFTMIDNLSSNSKQFEINGAPSEQVQRFTAPQGSTPVPGEDAITNKNNSSDFLQGEFLIGSNNDSNLTYCSSETYNIIDGNNFETVEDMEISDDNDPDYQPGRVMSPTILKVGQETSTVMNIPMLQSCEVPACIGSIHDSCNRCFKFLCLQHFKEKASCNEHGKLTNNVTETIHPHKPSTIGISSTSNTRIIHKNNRYIPQTCAVLDCFEEVFSACVHCNSLLCWSHFDGELKFVTCEFHKEDSTIPNTPSPINVQSLNLPEHLYPIPFEPEYDDDSAFLNTTSPVNVDSSTAIDIAYQVEGSEREFNLDKPKKVNKRKLAQSLRNAGQEYTCPKSKKIIPAKQIGAYCNVINCQLNSRDCRLFSDIDRKVIFAEFYSTGEIFLKRDYILRHVTEHDVKRKSVRPENQTSRRKRTLKYYLTLNGKKHQVCRTFFLNTLSVSKKFVRNSIAMPSSSGIVETKEARGGRVESLKERDLRINNMIRDHINRFPRVESHYCREKTTKEYLHSQLNVKKMHRMLLDELNDSPPGLDKPSLTCYKKVFTSMNLAFNRPKKDQCSLCAAYYEGSPEAKLALKERYDKHSAEKTSVRGLKDCDKKAAMSSNSKQICASFDLQQVIYLPTTNEGAIFYKRQLSVYNFTIYNLANRDCYCFTWPETESRRGSSEISTSVSIFIHEHDVPSSNSISLYADGCAGQNKNSIMASALLHCINNTAHIQTITLRYFAPSHGQNEGDSAHSAINYAIKKAGDLFLPTQLHPIIQMARSDHPYIVRPLQYTDFKDYKELSKKIDLLKLRKDNETGAPINWTDVVEFKVEKSSPFTLYFKTSHAELDASYRSITVKRGSAKFLAEPVGQLNASHVKINKAKYDDLMSMCRGDTAIIRHQEYKDFYINLPHEE